jgi:Ca2+-binding EF-hand superfamily protein
MVLIKIALIISLFFVPAHSFELSKEEIDYFKIVDLNNDGFITSDEINQSTNIIFQLIDINNDKKISLTELEQLKEILDIIR